MTKPLNAFDAVCRALLSAERELDAIGEGFRLQVRLTPEQGVDFLAGADASCVPLLCNRSLQAVEVLGHTVTWKPGQ